VQPQNVQPLPNQPVQQQTINGRIVRMEGTDRVLVRTPDNREVTLFVNPQTRYLVNDRPVTFNDLRVGGDINATYLTQDGRFVVNTVTLGGTPEVVQPAQPGTALEGTIVRVVGTDQVIIRTSTGQEVPVYVQPQTVYTINEQPAQLTQFAPGAAVRIDYGVQDGRHMARGIHGLIRR